MPSAATLTVRTPSRSGFTLVEISIVLVIIGLIVGGILVGQDLIQAASIRAQVSQIEKYQTSVNTFRTKYGWLPGDMPRNRVAALGFFAETVGHTQGHQDGNGLIEGGSGGGTAGVGETLGFWRHLTDAQMIDGNFGTATSGSPLAGNSTVPVALTAGTLSQMFPSGKLGRGNYLIVYGLATGQYNYYHLVGLTQMTTAGQYTGQLRMVTPIEAQSIDQKMDDGVAVSGNVRAMQATLPTVADLGGTCVTAAAQYDIGSTNGSTPTCQLQFRMN